MRRVQELNRKGVSPRKAEEGGGEGGQATKDLVGWGWDLGLGA